ncbi:replication-associated recombination protein A [Alteromonadaceae bacterium BrNp21-10]|nr:replication-associated recombination protein A [Alteromonadaceae bacterium BrNp21-10]
MRPKTIDEYFGQSHIVGAGKPLYQSIQAGRAHSMILWGPPGTGKTTLAEIVAKHANAHLERISAVTSGVKDIRSAIESAKYHAANLHKNTILFVDEVHRFNKSQQDAFLPFIEDGTVTFIGATTENPSFELNNALLSRTRVYLLKSLTDDDLLEILERALTDEDRGLGQQHIQMDDEAKGLLCSLSAGDARRLLNNLELSADFAEQGVIDKNAINQAVGDKISLFDKGGDQFYDMLSALHKSVRGSSPDAALYWYARILQGGGDPLVVARRLLAIASEDVGTADPRALQVTLNAWDIFQRVGPAEGERAIAEALVFCATAAKSNALYMAFNQAKEDAKNLPDYEVPLHLRNAPTKLLKEMGHGAEYRYAHNEPGAFAAGECYLPEALKNKQYYQPNERGMEKQIKAKLDYLASLNQQSELKRYE